MKIKCIKAGICAIAALFGIFMVFSCCSDESFRTQARNPETVILIDAGHGGIDGGAVSSDGTPEKNINLAIALKVRDLAEKYDCDIVMTRTEDVSLCDGNEGSIRAMKTADLRARREMLCDYRPAAAVSIHLNSFKEDPSVKGAQVFYPEGLQDQELKEHCREFANIMQSSVSDASGQSDERTSMAKGDVFLFKDEICPVIIIECGFLSNKEEAALLKTDEYQQRLAEGIMAGIVEFTGIGEEIQTEVIDSLHEKNKR